MSKLLKYKGLDIDPRKLHESTTIKLPATKTVTLSESAENTFVLPKIEAIHVGRTKNYVHYTADKLKGDAALKSGVYSWADPYAKPVIYNHDIHTEATGRVLRAAYSEYTQAGRPGIIVVPKITDPKAVKAIQDGRLLTVSVGAHTDAAICSICGTDIANEGYCGHMKGEEYDGETAEWIAGNIWFDELSWVNLPADQDAMIVERESALLVQTDETEEVKESATPADINAFYGVPKGVAIVEAVSSEFNLPDKGGEEVGKETTEIVEETVETEEEVVETTEDVETEEKPADEQSESTDDVTTEDAEEDEADKPSDAEDAEHTEEAEAPGESDDEDVTEVAESAELERVRALNVALEAQVAALTEELKGFYTTAILEKSNMDDDQKERYTERLAKRSLEGLKETFEDVEGGFFVPVKTKEKRKTEKVTSPLKESQEEEKKKDEPKKIDVAGVISSMLSR